MLRVAIIEDEMLVKMGMKICVEESKCNLKVVSAMESAEEALVFFEHNEVEVLITDIRLVGMSGLDLLEKIKDKIPQMVVIVISCYEDFSYARRAYEVGADKYILKHELKENMLPEIIITLYNEKFVNKREIKTEKNIDTMPDEFVLVDKEIFVGILKLRNKDASNIQHENVSMPILLESVRTIIQNQGCGNAFFNTNQSTVICIFTFEKKPNELYQNIINTVFFMIQEKIESYFNLDSFLYVDLCDQKSKNVREKYRELKQTIDWLFYNVQPCVVARYNIEEDRNSNKINTPMPISFSNHWGTNMCKALDEYFEEQKNNLISPKKVRIEIDSYMHLLLHRLARDFEIFPEDLLQSGINFNYVQIEEIANIKKLCEWAKEMTCMMIEYVAYHKKFHPLVAKVMMYVEKNYVDKITLEDIEREFHVSQTYFCRIFKKQTGTNFINYLNQFRIEKAIYLLNTTELSIEQISEAVGIQSHNYFFRLFKKTTGQTVGEYRKS